MSCLLPLVVPTVPCPRSPVPPLKINPKGVYPMESNVFDIVCYLQKFPLSRVPVPPSHLKINPKGVYPMESNVFDVVSVTSSSSHCPLSPGPLSLSKD